MAKRMPSYKVSSKIPKVNIPKPPKIKVPKMVTYKPPKMQIPKVKIIK